MDIFKVYVKYFHIIIKCTNSELFLCVCKFQRIRIIRKQHQAPVSHLEIQHHFLSLLALY